MPIQMTPEQQQAMTIPQGTPEILRILAQVLPAFAPTGATGAALTAGTQGGPQTAWGQLAALAPLALGAMATLRGPGKGEGLESLKKMFLARGGVEAGEGQSIQGSNYQDFLTSMRTPLSDDWQLFARKWQLPLSEVEN